MKLSLKFHEKAFATLHLLWNTIFQRKIYFARKHVGINYEMRTLFDSYYLKELIFY